MDVRSRVAAGSSERAIEHLAVCRRLLTCPTPQCAPIPITIAAWSALRSQSSCSHSFSSLNAVRQASDSELSETIVISRSAVSTRGTPIDGGRRTGVAQGDDLGPDLGRAHDFAVPQRRLAVAEVEPGAVDGDRHDHGRAAGYLAAVDVAEVIVCLVAAEHGLATGRRREAPDQWPDGNRPAVGEAAISQIPLSTRGG